MQRLLLALASPGPEGLDATIDQAIQLRAALDHAPDTLQSLESESSLLRLFTQI